MQDSAEQFYKDYHGKPFNSLESVACWLVMVIKVEVMKTSQGATLPSPDFVELPSCPVCLEKLVNICKVRDATLVCHLCTCRTSPS